MTSGVAIIGTGHGGVQVAASLREEGYEGPISLIGDEQELPYHKPPLSKTFMKSEDAQPQILRAESYYQQNQISLHLGRRVTRIGSHRLELSGGQSLEFDHLVLALGSRARKIGLQGQELAGVHSLRDIADARAIRDDAHDAKDVVIIGGGFIGLEIAATLRAGGRAVTVVEAQPRILGRAVAPLIAGHVHRRLEAIGVKVLTHSGLERLEGNEGRVAGAVLASGQRIAAQLVIIGVGAVPNVELASAAGIACANGVEVDPQMRTSAQGVLAIGDCANFRHWMTGTPIRLESVQNATDQGRAAAKTILDRGEDYAAVPWFWSDIGDMKLQMAGLAGRGDQSVIAGDQADNRFSVYHFADGKLIAIESVNRPADHMLGRRILATSYTPDIEMLKRNADGLKAAFQSWAADNLIQ